MSDGEKKSKAVVAGCNWGGLHAQAFAESGACELAAVWSRTDNPSLRGLGERYAVPVYTDYEKMLAEIKPKIASVAVPEGVHEKLTLAALNGGCHVYCEKVLADSREAAQRMVAAAKDNNRELNVGYNYRYSPSCIYMAEALKQGKIGTPLFAHLRAFGCCIHHMTDYVNSLFGTPVRTVAKIRKEPLDGKPLPPWEALVFPTFIYAALASKTYMVEYDTGAVLMAGATDYSSIEGPGAVLLVEGSDGRMELDDLTGKVTVWGKSREAIVYKPSQILDKIGLGNNCIAAVKDFASAVCEGKPAPIPGQAGVNMIALEEAVYKSAHSLQWEEVE